MVSHDRRRRKVRVVRWGSSSRPTRRGPRPRLLGSEVVARTPARPVVTISPTSFIHVGTPEVRPTPMSRCLLSCPMVRGSSATDWRILTKRSPSAESSCASSSTPPVTRRLDSLFPSPPRSRRAERAHHGAGLVVDARRSWWWPASARWCAEPPGAGAGSGCLQSRLKELAIWVIVATSTFGVTWAGSPGEVPWAVCARQEDGHEEGGMQPQGRNKF